MPRRAVRPSVPDPLIPYVSGSPESRSARYDKEPQLYYNRSDFPSYDRPTPEGEAQAAKFQASYRAWRRREVLRQLMASYTESKLAGTTQRGGTAGVSNQLPRGRPTSFFNDRNELVAHRTAMDNLQYPATRSVLDPEGRLTIYGTPRKLDVNQRNR